MLLFRSVPLTRDLLQYSPACYGSVRTMATDPSKGIVFSAKSSSNHLFGEDWRSGCSFPEKLFTVHQLSPIRDPDVLDGMTRFQKIKIIFSGAFSSGLNYSFIYNSIYRNGITKPIYPFGRDISFEEEIIPVTGDGTPLKFIPHPEINSFEVVHKDTRLEVLANYLYLDPTAIASCAGSLIAHSTFLSTIFSQFNQDTDPQKILNAIQANILLLNTIVHKDGIEANLKTWVAANLTLLKESADLMIVARGSAEIGRVVREVKKKIKDELAETNQKMIDLSSFLAKEIDRLKDIVPVDDKNLLDSMTEISNKIKSHLSP